MSPLIAGQPGKHDKWLFRSGDLFQAYRNFSPVFSDEEGVFFNVWAPEAESVHVLGDFNNWEKNRASKMKTEGDGFWSLAVPEARENQYYKYLIEDREGGSFLKADPYAVYAEKRPGDASRLFDLRKYVWHDSHWTETRKAGDSYGKPMLIYEIHLDSWRCGEKGDACSYRELAEELVPYLRKMKYTHVEIMPVMEHPFDGSWGYQITGYYAPTSRYGSPDDFRYLVDSLHQENIGVILDWVPGHFCPDSYGLASFDGSPVYEAGKHPEWGTYIFDFAKPEVHSFLVSNAFYWFSEYHVDGLRVDAVSSMLYLDYGRKKGEWQPNRYGGRENLDAIAFLKKMNTAVFGSFPNAIMAAEESTSWPLVTMPVDKGGLGFNYKWNMGWMNDVLRYMAMSPSQRKNSHHLLTFSFFYAFSENFILPLSHDEVVHGKKSLLDKMYGNYGEKFANLKILYVYMMTHPGKKIFFMGSEIAQFIEWDHNRELDWFLLDYPAHGDFFRFTARLNDFYCREPALWREDFSWDGFEWIDSGNNAQSVISFIRKDPEGEENLIAVINFSDTDYENFRIGVPEEGVYEAVFSTNGEGKETGTECLAAKGREMHGFSSSFTVALPALSAIILKRKGFRKKDES